MKLRVEHIKLKTLITEATYQDAFKQIKKGDTLVVKTGDKVWNAKITDVFSNQVRFEYGGETFIITSNSFNGNTLSTHFVYKNPKTGEEKTTKGKDVTGVYGMVIKRGNQIVTSVTPDSGRPKPQEKSQEKAQDEFENRKDDLVQTFNELEVGDVLEITTGKLITKGLDKGSLAKNTITKITLKVESTDGGRTKMSPTGFDGADASKYKTYHNSYFWFDAGSIGITKEGLTLTPTVKNLDDGSLNKVTITNVFGVDNIGKFKEKPDVTMNDIMQIPAMRNLMFKNPSLLDKILKRGPKGLIPLKQKLAKYGFNTRPSKGKRVKFQFNGADIRPDYRFNFKDGKAYIGKFTKDDVIKRTADNRRESMYITLENKIDDNTYQVKIDFVRLVNNEPQREEVGRGKIKILEINK